MIIRITTEGQYNLPGSFVDQMNEIDNQLVEAVEAAERSRFDGLLKQMLDLVRENGSPLPVEELPELPDLAHGGPADRDRGLDIKYAVRAALDALPPRQRSAVVLNYYQGFTNREAGELLGVSAEAVESLLARARRALKSRLKDAKHELIGDKT